MGKLILMCLAATLILSFAVMGVIYVVKEIVREGRNEVIIAYPKRKTCNKSSDDAVNASIGKWELKTFDDGYGEYQLYECNSCGAVTAQRKNYCYDCGARMIEAEVEDD